jgi:hypothetical protein
VIPSPDFSKRVFNSSAYTTVEPPFPLTRDQRPVPELQKLCFHVDWPLNKTARAKAVGTFMKTILSNFQGFLDWRSSYPLSFSTQANPVTHPTSRSQASEAANESPTMSTMNSQERPDVAAASSSHMPLVQGPDLERQMELLNHRFDTMAPDNEATRDRVNRLMAILEQVRGIQGDDHQDGDRLGPARPANGHTPAWKASEIDFFYPDMPWSWGAAKVVDKDDRVYYRTVHGFTN